ncbi:terminase small subunit [Clostridium sp. JS66]|uniref:terminase small subunit n=1 Tax=Clostridium sp. JS66 TaxID=3064705 RepID=UPI00298EA60E|nr:terminase small subunit [Clostridium sp. JS66]WPC42946.1 terminase small subunit [Clostridium sp. JS66]
MSEEKLKKDGTVSRQGENGGRPLKWKNVNELIEYANNFFDWCEENKKRPTVTRLAYYLGCDRKDLIRYENYKEYDWLKRLSEEEKKKYSHTIKEIKRRIEAEYEDSLFDKSSTVGAIFTLKNNYNWIEKQEVITSKDNSNSDLSADEIEKQLKELENLKESK